MAALEMERPRSRGLSEGAKALLRIETHEAVCAERWATVLSRMNRLEAIVISAAGVLITGMGALIVTLAMKGGH